MSSASVTTPPLERLPFLNEDPKRLWEVCRNNEATWKSLRNKQFSEAMVEYRKQRALNLVWQSNQLGGTLPNGVSQLQTYRLLETLYSDGSMPGQNDEAIGSGVDAEKDRCGSRQLQQHMRAYLICEREANAIDKRPLSENLIQEIHETLMNGLKKEDGILISAGKYRNEPVHAGNHVFPRYSLVPGAMAKMVEGYNQTFAERHDPYALASWLLYQVVTIHPFQDGNGRLCRLLASYSLMRDGLPFPVTISSGRSKAHKHYVQAIVRDHNRGRGGQPHLTTLTVFSVSRGWNNFCTNQQYNPSISESELDKIQCI